jgi:branched-chain amino acid transport system ATP-binding protein
MNAIDMICIEHRALAAVLSGLVQFTDGVAAGRFATDFDLLEAMIAYITELPDKGHHPKEDDYLFKALRKRSPDIGSVLDALQAEHREGPAKTHALLDALKRYRIGGAPELGAFRARVREFVDAQWQHMSTEETKVLPVARAVLRPDDWMEINEAFASNDNPWEGPAGVYRKLFTRIVTMAPAPIGVGGPKEAALSR